MKHILVILTLLLAQPLHASSLQFDISGRYTVGFDPRFGGTFNVSYLLNTAPGPFTYADVQAPDGTTVHDYLTGSEPFSASVDSTGDEPFPHVGTVSLQLDKGTPLSLWAFSMDQYIYATTFNHYAYRLTLWALGDVFLQLDYSLGLSPSTQDGVWDRSFIESMSDPDTLLARAVLNGTYGFMEISQFNIDLNVDRFTIAAVPVPEPSSAALLAAGLVFLFSVAKRRTRHANSAEPVTPFRSKQ